MTSLSLYDLVNYLVWLPGYLHHALAIGHLSIDLLLGA